MSSIKKKILVTGATGLVGSRLLPALLAEGHTVRILSRSSENQYGLQSFLWDIDKRYLDPESIKDTDLIIHLAGEPIAGKRWTAKQKTKLVESRVISTEMLADAIKNNTNRVDQVIAASAIGYYGDRGDEVLGEDAGPGEGFLADCCILWEQAINQFSELGIPTTILRLGIVLDKEKGSLPVMAKPIKLGLGAPLGDGNQWVSWIHQNDLVRMILHFVNKDQSSATYNAVAPHPVMNKTLTTAIADSLRRPVWPVKVPNFLLELILGEMSAVVTTSTNVSAQKVISDGFSFKFAHLSDALEDLYGKD